VNSIILRGLGTATPPFYATQEEAYEYFLTHFSLKPTERDLYRRILLDGKIKGRYLGMDAKAIPIFFASVAEKGIPLYQNNQQLIEPREQTDGATPRRVCFVASESPK
jgi:hypothetical protein